MWTVVLVMECELVVTEGYFLQIYALEICTAFEALVPVHAVNLVGCAQSWLENWEHWNWESCSEKNCHQLNVQTQEWIYSSAWVTGVTGCELESQAHFLQKTESGSVKINYGWCEAVMPV